MIQLNRIGHVLLRVADIERSKAFYSKLLGFEDRRGRPRAWRASS